MNLLKSISVYFIGSLVNSAIPFLLLPFFTHYFSAADFGYLTLFQVFSSFVLPMVIVGIQVSINTRYFSGGDPGGFTSYVSSALAIPVLATALLALTFLVGGRWLSPLVGLGLGWMEVGVALAALQVLPTVVLFLLQASKKPVHYTAFQLSTTAFNFGLSIGFIALAGKTWEGRVYGLLATNLAFSLVGLAWLHRKGYLEPRVDRGHFFEAFRFGAFLIPHEIGGIAIQMADRLVVNMFAGIALLGIYSVAYQVGSIISFVALAFNQAWIPHLFSQLSAVTDERKRCLVRISYLVMAGFLASAFLMILGARIIFHFFINPKFAAAEPLVFWLALGFAFTGMYYVVVNYIIFTKKTHILAYITLSNGVLNVALTYLFIQSEGILGAAKAQALGSLVFFLATWAFSIKVYPMPWFQFRRKALCN